MKGVTATQLRSLNASQQVEIQSLVSIAQEILDAQGNLEVQLKQNGQDDREAMMSLLSTKERSTILLIQQLSTYQLGVSLLRSGMYQKH